LRLLIFDDSIVGVVGGIIAKLGISHHLLNIFLLRRGFLLHRSRSGSRSA
jgi:phage shock protein PspC (stress-responsive transcriptional regulator)